MFCKTDKIYGKEADDGPLEEELKSFFALSLSSPMLRFCFKRFCNLFQVSSWWSVELCTGPRVTNRFE